LKRLIPALAGATPIGPDLVAARRRPLLARSLVLARIASEKLISADYKHVDGTSFSAPIVSSIVAQMLEARPNLDPREVKEILCDTAVLLAGVPPEVQGHGLVAPDRALAATLSLIPEPRMML
jgi:serine protease AprX